jgi:uncharacterized protein
MSKRIVHKGGTSLLAKKRPAAVTHIDSTTTICVPSFLTVHGKTNGWCVAVRAKPTGKRNRIVSMEGDSLEIELAARPVDGEANAELVEFLSDVFRVKKKDCVLVSGERSRDKVVLVSHSSALNAEQIVIRLRTEMS